MAILEKLENARKNAEAVGDMQSAAGYARAIQHVRSLQEDGTRGRVGQHPSYEEGVALLGEELRRKQSPGANGQPLTYEEGLALIEEEERQKRPQENGYGQQLYSGGVEGAKGVLNAPFDFFGPGDGYGPQIRSGMLVGATGLLGFPIDAVNNLVVAPAVKGVNAVFGTNLQPSAEPLGGSAGLRLGMPIVPESKEDGPRFARRMAESVGGAIPGAALARTSLQAAIALGTAAVGGGGGATAQYFFPQNFWADMAGELAGSGFTAATINGILGRLARRIAADATPTVAKLDDMASDKYAAAQDNGVVASPADTAGLAVRVRDRAREDGMITPTGRVTTIYPRAAETIKLLDDYASNSMNPVQMQGVREMLADVRHTAARPERKIASGILDEFDSFTDSFGPELVDARELAERALKANQLETMRKTAGYRAGKGSSPDETLKADYRKKWDDLEAGQAREWTPEQQEAIQRAAFGTNASKALAWVGKIAPSSPFGFFPPAAATTALGAALGKPVLGGAVGLGASMLGYGSRALAAKMGRDYAKQAELLVRRGGVTPAHPASHDAVRQRLIEAIVGGTIGGLN